MAKKDNIKELLMQAKGLAEEEEESRAIVQAGKEFIMFFLWLIQMKVGLDEGKAKVYAASLLEDYPKELEEVLAYYQEVKDYDIRKNFKGFSPSIIGGIFRARIMWFHLDKPQEEK